MLNITRMTALALAIGGMTLVGCEGEAEIETTDAGERMERTTDNVARDMDRLGDDVARQTDRLADDAREAGAELRDTAGEAARAADRETREAARELGDAADRTADRMTDDTRTAVNPLRTGGEATDAAPDAESIRDTVASATEAAITDDGFDDMVERFVDADRNRIGEYLDDNDDFTALNEKAKAFRDQFQAKYDAEFDIADEGAVYSDQFATIRQSELQARQAAATDDPDANREEGRNVATVMIAKSHGLPQLTVNMIHEMPDSWRIDLPDTVTGKQLHDNLSKALDDLTANQDKWPGDKVEAQRYVTHRLLLAIHGQSASN